MSAKKGLEFIHVELKRDTWMNPETIVQTPNDAVEVIKGLLGNMDREMLVCINIASSGRVINASVCSVGTMDTALVSPPEILRGALLSGARSVIMLHNHPSGSITPSTEDMAVTKRMATASAVVGVKFLDSIIIGKDGQQFSFRDGMSEYLEPADLTSAQVAAEDGVEYTVNETADEQALEKPVRTDYASEHRKAVVEQMIELIESGKSFYSRQWSADAMRPRNPISGALYHGANRLILMNCAMKEGYKDPRWMTFKQLSEKGYYVKKGEKAVRLEKWIFTEKKPINDADGNPVKNAKGQTLYEEVLLEHPKCRLFSVFNGEQICVGRQAAIVFNYLDYLLWNANRKKYDGFVFEFRNSVEHWYPQNPSEGTFEQWKDGVDQFGNLCIIQRNVNSKFSNMSPEAKKSTFRDMISKGSIKLRIMSDLTERKGDKAASLCWKETIYKQHEEEMLNILKDACVNEEIITEIT